ncbi:MAG: FemAB family PEP-CTERM system-associated protein [Bryobacterales bacterium]|nr:FemAB family PEP-CTERM system-associated protein [Bryobacterales bacterium]MBV9397682.1 FemAB family PEP-CTERM system-associated protein [Bryobacterales bacterium]
METEIEREVTLVRDLERQDYAAWDRFVLEHPHGSPFHLTAWKESIETTFGYRGVCLMAVRQDRVCGVLPLFLVSNLLTGKRLISSPFAVYGGILADSEEAQLALLERAKAIGERLQVQDIELRNAWEAQCSGLPRISRYVTFTQEIGPDEETILNSIPRKTRAAVRKSLKEDLGSRQEFSNIAAFENLYSRNLRRLGTPCFPARHFSTLLEKFGGMASIREITLSGKVVAAVLSFYFRDQVLPYYGASDPAYNAAQPNNFMYYDLMRWGGQNGYRVFDFGRSKRVKGSYDFKSHWGMVERALPYEVHLVKRKKLPNYSPENSAFRLPILLWQRLPLGLTKVLGPRLVSLVP